MPPTGQLDSLLAHYFELRSRGEAVELEELCRDAPELLTDLRNEICLVEKSTVVNPQVTKGLELQVSRAVELTWSCGDYRLLRQIGRGGMGVVYLARQVSLNRLVALKRLLAEGFETPEGRARFRAEAAVIARLRHPNIVQVFEFC